VLLEQLQVTVRADFREDSRWLKHAWNVKGIPSKEHRDVTTEDISFLYKIIM
jgi:hypothetical protein